MSKPVAKWKYLKRPQSLLTCQNGWVFAPQFDTTIVRQRNGQAVHVQSAIGAGSATHYTEINDGPTLSLDHVKDERTGRWMLHLMLNMGRFAREPSWAEWKAVKDAIFGEGVDTAIILPRQENYVNLSEWVFHLWQLPEPWNVPTWGIARPTKHTKRLHEYVEKRNA